MTVAQSLGLRNWCAIKIVVLQYQNIRPHERVVRSSRLPPRFNIHVGGSALLQQRRSRKDVIDPPALVLLDRTRTQIIPERVLQPVRMEMAEYVHESPRSRLLVRLSYRLMKAHVPQMLLRAVNIDRFRRDIHVAAPESGLVGIEMLREVAAQPSVPLQLVRRASAYRP